MPIRTADVRRDARERVQAQRHALSYELSRLAQDLAGGLMVTLPSDAEFDSPVTGPILRKYLATRPDVRVDDRRRMLRLIENMTLGRNAVGYLTESMHGAGSPQAQRIQISRLMRLEDKKRLARERPAELQAERLAEREGAPSP